ncbi:aspartyl-phosphate phosphatase Spo0E family protein [Bacillus sp. 2205SS5-2]|uniref:aspartyl-phosphate phosphatase Spo0E family protein n=1 Tax=Bacillus sp. 2205SS5-2 TaxID=3109031 RepID=UPI0030074392
MDKSALLDQIELKRLELFKIVSENGLNSSIAIQYSQELDDLLNHYNHLYIKKLPPKQSVLI